MPSLRWILLAAHHAKSACINYQPEDNESSIRLDTGRALYGPVTANIGLHISQQCFGRALSKHTTALTDGPFAAVPPLCGNRCNA